MRWIDEGLLEYADKKRMPEWISKQQSNSAEVRNLYRHVANVLQNFENPNISTQNSETTMFRTPNGTIYGWAEGNKIYLTKDGLNPNTPIHEYTHLWAKAMMNKIEVHLKSTAL